MITKRIIPVIYLKPLDILLLDCYADVAAVAGPAWIVSACGPWWKDL